MPPSAKIVFTRTSGRRQGRRTSAFPSSFGFTVAATAPAPLRCRCIGAMRSPKEVSSSSPSPIVLDLWGGSRIRS